MSPPVIETERLILRRRRIEDFEAFAEIQADPLFQAHIAGAPVKREQAWIKFLRMEGHWALLGYGFWAIEERSTGRFIGEAGFADFKRDMILDYSNDPEAGWGLTPEAQGKGYAREAMAAALDWLDGEYAAPRSFCIISPENFRSKKLALDLGFEHQGQAAYKSENVDVYLRKRGAANA
jgi:RimJ/RimL family protein N-acetyltransferase